MNNSKLIIPTRCKVGFNTRTDTYTGKLGYVIYNDGKVWRKEPSWENWREKYMSAEEFEAKKLEKFNSDVKECTERYEKYKGTIKPHYYVYNWDAISECATLEDYLKYNKCNDYNTFKFSIPKISKDITTNPIEFDNVPTEGFVLNRKAGGNNYSWNPRQTYCRVYDPRGWEFEITIPNLLFILECANSVKGKGLEGEFIYSWDGKDLVLLPCDSENYLKSVEHTKLQDNKVSSKELKEGYTYINNQSEEMIYLGKLPILRSKADGEETVIRHSWKGGTYETQQTKYKEVIVKEFVFHKTYTAWDNSIRKEYVFLTSLTTIKKEISNVIPEGFATFVEDYYKHFKTKINE